MKTIYKGDTTKIPLQIKFHGEEILTTDERLNNVLMEVYSRLNREDVIGQYRLFPFVGDEGWKDFYVEDNKVFLILDASDTIKVVDAELVAEITIEIIDSTIPGGINRSTGTAVFLKIKDKKTWSQILP